MVLLKQNDVRASLSAAALALGVDVGLIVFIMFAKLGGQEWS